VSPKRILVCAPQIPFVRGGAEIQVEQLVRALRENGFETETIALPFQDYSHERLIRNASVWRLLDLDADVVIATKFPSYFVSHPNKITWLFHNYRGAYDLHGTPYGGYSRNRSDDLQLIEWIHKHDKQFLPESKKILTISANVRNRLRNFLDLDGEVLYAPSPLKDRLRCDGYEPFVFAAQRLDSFKRTDLLIRAMALVPGNFRAVIAGTGPDESKLHTLAKELGTDHRIDFVGKITDQQLLDYYSRCRLVFFAPFDEDYGLTTIEAFQAKKPVLTATDSGGPLEFVEHRINGWIAEPDPDSLATGIQEVMEQAEKLGEAGHQKVKNLSWEKTISRFKEIFRDLHL
jgi:glycosyltransferase involved in cell wall biosynthesis